MAAFANVQQLANYLQMTVTNSAATLALDAATARIKRRTGQDFELVEDDVVELEGGTGLLRLPQRPVIAVTKVETSSGYAPSTYVTVTEGTQFSRIGAELTWLGSYAWPAKVRVTHDHGYAVIPDDARECCLALAGEAYTNPAGLSSETIDDYTWRAGESRGLELLDELVKDYKVKRSVILR